MRLSTQLSNLKDATTPSISWKKSRFDEIVTALLEIGLSEYLIENMDVISWKEFFEGDPPTNQLLICKQSGRD